eukprot:SM000217S06854  [mRNA]  locus=s217:147123:148968:+ [translate_table: standard]
MAMAAGPDACAGDCRGGRASPGLSGKRVAVSVSGDAAQRASKPSARLRPCAPAGKRRAQGGQLFLDLGQADFSSTTCRACGLLYAPGLPQDEQLHASFHRRATGGVPFEGWKQERVVKAAAPGGGRILMIDAQDPFRQRQKAREVLQVVAVELGLDFNWLQEAHCKTYLHISTFKKVVGCLVAEPISEAFALTSTQPSPPVSSISSKVHDTAQSPGTVGAGAMKGVTMRFGNVTFRREVVAKRRSRQEEIEVPVQPSLTCLRDAKPASCGIRAIWVQSAERRRGIATGLLEALRHAPLTFQCRG